MPSAGFWKTLRSGFKRVAAFPLLVLVQFYRYCISPFTPPSCRFTPTCSQYAVEALRKYGLVERTDIIAFSLNACLAFKKLLPDSKIYYLDGDLTPKKIKKLGLAGIDYSIEALRKHPEWVEQAHKLGLEVNVWTVDKEEDMRYFIDLGVDYITTNYPEQLQQLIGEK